MFCTQCGNKMNDSDKFCSSCGAKNNIEKPVEVENKVVEPVVKPVEKETEVAQNTVEQEIQEQKPEVQPVENNAVEESKESAEQEVASFEDLLKGIVEDNSSEANGSSDDKLIDTDTKIFEAAPKDENDEVADKLTELIENQNFENQAHEMEIARELFFDDDSEVSKEDLEEDFYSPIEEETKKERKERLKREERIRKGKNPDKSVGKVILKILLILLIIILLLEVAVIGIKILSPTSKAGETVDKYITKTIDFFKGSSSETPSTEDSDEDDGDLDEDFDIRHQPDEDLGQIIEDKEDLNYANTIGAIEYSSNLKFKKNYDYDNTNVKKSKPISENLWYSEGEENIYYDESAVENIINYEVQRLNLIDNQDDTVLRMVEKNSDLYKALKNSKGAIKEDMSKLLIGDIRMYNDYVFVWVNEEIETTHNGKSKKRQRERVYYMHYDKNHVVKIEGFEDI